MRPSGELKIYQPKLAGTGQDISLHEHKNYKLLYTKKAWCQAISRLSQA